MNKQDEYGFNGDMPDLTKMMQSLGLGDKKKLTPKEETMLNDQRINDLALYAVTHGLTTICKDPMIVQNKFVEFKRLVKRGSFTIEQLEDHVCIQFGITSAKNQDEEFNFLNEEV